MYQSRHIGASEAGSLKKIFDKGGWPTACPWPGAMLQFAVSLGKTIYCGLDHPSCHVTSGQRGYRLQIDPSEAPIQR
jgi:hypothetical protein